MSFLMGLWIGAIVGVFTMALMFSAKETD